MSAIVVMLLALPRTTQLTDVFCEAHTSVTRLMDLSIEM
jgi:hypothetical protein